MTRHSVRGILLAAAMAVVLTLTHHETRVAAQAPSAPCGTDLRVLVISAAGTEADLPAIEQALDYLGTPYDVYVATENAGGLTPDRLASGCHALYQSVILATDNLGYTADGGTFSSAFTSADFQTLANYEASFGVRQVTWYTYPTPDLGFNYPATASGDPLTAQLTASGKDVFPYLNADPSGSGIPIQFSWTYFTTPSDDVTTPLITDAAGHSLAAIHVYPDGRENLAMTFDSNPYVVHAMLLSYGVINWATRGLFVGERHAYMSPQVDDLFIDDTQWLTTTPCGTDVDLTGVQMRIGGLDLAAVSSWQTMRHADPLTPDIRTTLAFNGYGTTSDFTLLVGKNDTLVGGVTTGGAPDTLTPAASALQQEFFWASHTYDHENLDAISYADATTELTNNDAVAVQLGLANYARRFMVQPDVSGLGNPDFLKAAFDHGLRYLLSDTSKPGQGNPSPNLGFWTTLGQPGIFVIPRRANNLFYNVATPADWAAEYNCHYNSFWGRDLSYQEILDAESDQLVADLLRGELDPWMFHQPNLLAYDGVHTLLTDLLDRTISKYGSYVNVPIVSPPIETVGDRMANRTALRTSGITATLVPGVGLSLRSPVDVTVPITGLHLPGAEQYAGQWIAWVSLKANQEVVEPFSGVDPPSVTAGAAQAVSSGAAVALTATATDSNLPPLPLTYSWSQTSGDTIVALTGADSAAASFTAPTLTVGMAPLTLGFTVTASNGPTSASATTSVEVDPPVGPPTATAGPAQNVTSGATVTLAGTVSDPNVPARTIAASWSQAPGDPPVAFSNASSAVTTFSAPALTVGASPLVLTFTLTADNGLLAASSTTAVVVNPPVGPPASLAGGVLNVAAGSAVSLAGAASDPNVPPLPLSYTWTQTSGSAVSLTGGDTLNPSFSAPPLAPGDPPAALGFKLTVSNGLFSTTSAATTVVVQSTSAPISATRTVSSDGIGNRTTPAIAVGAGDLVVAFVSGDLLNALLPGPQAATVTGGGLSWTLVRRVTAQFGTSEIWVATAPAAMANVTVTATMAFPTSQASLTVTTFAGASGIGASAAASAVSGAPAVVLTTTRAMSFVYGVGNDWDGTAARTPAAGQTLVHQYLGPADTHWVQTLTAGAVAAASTVTLKDTAPTNHRWNFAAVEIQALWPLDGHPPTVSAGAAQTVPSSSAVVLSGVATDSNVPPRPLAYTWTQTAGAAVVLANANTPTPTFNAPALAPGAAPVTLSFSLAANNGLATATATTSVVVQAPPGPPAANAGAGQTVSSAALVTLSGAATDPNVPARPLTYTWAQTSGPAVVLSDPTALVTSFTAPALSAGDSAVVLGFSLAVSNGALTTTSSTSVVVQPGLVPVPLAVARTVFSEGTGNRTTPAFAVNAGDLVVAFVSGDLLGSLIPGPQAATVTGAGLTWTLVRRVAVQYGTSEIWAATAPTAIGNATVTATMAFPTSQTSLTVLTFTGASGIGASAGANGTTAPSVALTTSKPGSLVYAVGNDYDGAVARTLPAGQALVHQYLGSADTHWVQTLTAGAVAAAPTTVTLRDTAPTNHRFNFAAVEIQALWPVAPPAVTLGTSQTVASAAAVTLAATASDPNVPARPLTYTWAQTSGPTVALSGASAATASFIAPTLAPGDPSVSLGFTLTVSNGLFSTSATTTVVAQSTSAALAVARTVFSEGTGNRTTPAFAVNAGDLVVAFVSGDLLGSLIPGPQAATVTGAGLTWTLVRRVAVQYGTSEIWAATAPTAIGAATVTATMAFPTSQTSLTVLTFTGAGGIGASAGANGTTAPSVALTTSKPGSLVYAVGNDYDGAVARTLPAGQTLVHQYLGPADTHWVQTLTAGVVAAAPTTVTLRDTAPTNHRFNFAAVEIQAR